MHINFIGPWNTTGYGHASIGYFYMLASLLDKEEYTYEKFHAFKYCKTLEIDKKNLINLRLINLFAFKFPNEEFENITFSFIPIGNPDLRSKDINDEYLQKLYNRHITTPDKVPQDAINIVFWHASNADQFILPCKKNILITTFEVDYFSSRERESIESFDLLCAASSFNRDILVRNFPKKRVLNYLLPHLRYFTKVILDRFRQVPLEGFHSTLGLLDIPKPMPKEDLYKYLNLKNPSTTRIISTIGKFEARKGCKELIQIIADQKDDRLDNTNLLAFWFNPFIYPNFPFGELIAEGFVEELTTDKYFTYVKGNKRIILHKPVETREELYGLCAATDLFLCLSKAEGFNLPLADIFQRKVPSLAFANHAHMIDLHYNTSYILGSLNEYEKADDGFFFRGEADWCKIPLDKTRENIISFFTTKLKSKHFFDDPTVFSSDFRELSSIALFLSLIAIG